MYVYEMINTRKSYTRIQRQSNRTVNETVGSTIQYLYYLKEIQKRDAQRDTTRTHKIEYQATISMIMFMNI